MGLRKQNTEKMQKQLKNCNKISQKSCQLHAQDHTSRYKVQEMDAADTVQFEIPIKQESSLRGKDKQ